MVPDFDLALAGTKKIRSDCAAITDFYRCLSVCIDAKIHAALKSLPDDGFGYELSFCPIDLIVPN